MDTISGIALMLGYDINERAMDVGNLTVSKKWEAKFVTAIVRSAYQDEVFNRKRKRDDIGSLMMG